jgi:hypothetical protein
MGIRSEKTFEDIVERLALLPTPELSPERRDDVARDRIDGKALADGSSVHADVMSDPSQDPAT